ncbi:MAG: ATP synthase F1 subunit epsilon [Parachlamydiaceae bacterium]|nr:ATP synthase F1 subunit epsilon [Parachlamydiaceae bacterium]
MNFFLSFDTPEKVIFEGNVISLIAPGTIGYLEILANHAPIITTLVPGKVTITLENQEKKIFAISYGFLKVDKNNVSLLVDAAELASQINPEKAKIAIQKAEKLLRSESPETDIARAKKALGRAKNRLKIYEDYTASKDSQR